ncbi:MAG: phage major capsid protein, partial [Clostridia bacterium]|nr:phage major capsid protein [Clostridia bacterium]
MAIDYSKVQTLSNMEKALKENYLPVWRNGLTTEPSPLLSKIKKVPLKSDKIVATAPIGLSGGFGFGAEGMATPAAGRVQFERFETRAKDMYVNIAISAKAVRLTGSGGAMANALDTEVKAAYETAKWNVGRSLFGNGDGVLSKCTCDGTNVIAVEDAKFMKEGLIIDIMNDDKVHKAGIRILAVDRVGKKITVTENVTNPSGQASITVQNSYKKEITGLGAIFDEKVKNIYGVDRTNNAYLFPTVIGTDETANEINDGVLWDAVEQAETYKNSKIDLMLMGRSAYKSYVDYLRTNNTRIETITKEIVGGFKSLAFAFGNREIDMVYEQFVPENEVWCIES